MKQKKKPFIVEIKLSWDTLKKDDLKELEKEAKKINAIPLVIVIKGEPKIPLITHAIRKEIIIMSGEALRLLAKKINFPHW